MKTSVINMHTWVQANRKKITKDEFRQKTGMDFDNFSHTYKKECLEAWKYYQDEKPERESNLSHEREKHLLSIIGVWKGRYNSLKRAITHKSE